MKSLALALLIFVGVAMQEPEELPPGHVCVTPAQVKGPTDHPCDCQRKCIVSEDENGKESISVQEDAQCKQYCHKDHCSCPMKDCP